MAFKLAELFVQITGQDAGFRKTLASAHHALLGLAGAANNLGALGVFGAVGAIGSLGVALGVSARTAVDLEQKFVALQKATDLDPNGMRSLEAELKKLAVTLKGISYGDLLAIATTGAKMGVAAGDLAEYTEGIAKVSTAMDDIPAEQIADQIGKVNVVFKLGVKGAMQLGSAIDKLADSGASSASGILNVTQRLSGAAVGAKLTAAETTALAATLLDTGTNAELGASALGHLIQSLNKAQAQKTFGKVLGESADEFARRVKAGPMDAIQAFLGALKKLDAGSQNAALEGIGIEGQGLGEIQKLAQQVANLKDYAAKAKHEFESLDQVNKSYAASSGTVGAKLEQVKNQFLLLAQQVGNALMPAIRMGLDLLSGWASAAGSAFETLVIGAGRVAERVRELPANITAAFGPGPVGLVTGLASAVGGFLTDKLELLGILIRNFPDFFDILVLEGTQAFMNIGETIAVLPENLAIIGNYIRNNWSKLIVDGVNLAISAFKNLGTNLASLGSAIVGFLQDPTKGFKFEWTELTKGFEATADELPELIKPRLTSLQDQINEKFRKVADQEGKVKRGVELAKEPAKAKEPDGGENKLDGGKGKDKGKVSDLASFATSLQEAVSGKNRAAEETAAGVKQVVAELKILNGRKNQDVAGVALGPAWKAAGLC